MIKKNNDLEDLIEIKEEVLNYFKDMPNMYNRAKMDNNLCYYVNTGNGVFPIIDFTKKTPLTMKEYTMMINESVKLFALYDINNIIIN